MFVKSNFQRLNDLPDVSLAVDHVPNQIYNPESVHAPLTIFKGLYHTAAKIANTQH